jgi:hypothetical protein
MVFIMGIVIFNHLPCNLKECFNDFKNFKSAIKNLLLKQCFYSTKEYFEWPIKSKQNPYKFYLFKLMSGEIILISAYEYVIYILHYYFYF